MFKRQVDRERDFTVAVAAGTWASRLGAGTGRCTVGRGAAATATACCSITCRSRSWRGRPVRDPRDAGRFRDRRPGPGAARPRGAIGDASGPAASPQGRRSRIRRRPPHRRRERRAGTDAPSRASMPPSGAGSATRYTTARRDPEAPQPRSTGRAARGPRGSDREAPVCTGDPRAGGAVRTPHAARPARRDLPAPVADLGRSGSRTPVGRIRGGRRVRAGRSLDALGGLRDQRLCRPRFRSARGAHPGSTHRRRQCRPARDVVRIHRARDPGLSPGLDDERRDHPPGLRRRIARGHLPVQQALHLSAPGPPRDGLRVGGAHGLRGRDPGHPADRVALVHRHRAMGRGLRHHTPWPTARTTSAPA